MSADPEGLRTALGGGDLRLEPLAQAHREPLRAACAADEAIWAMYLVRLVDPDFDTHFDRFLADPARVAFAVVANHAVLGMSSYSSVSGQHRGLEIGMTYLAPDARGTGINARMKRLMIDHAIACGFERIEFCVDIRNARSQAAVAKLGAVREGVRRRDRVTWTGHVRDTVVFSILRDEWRA